MRRPRTPTQLVALGALLGIAVIIVTLAVARLVQV